MSVVTKRGVSSVSGLAHQMIQPH